MSSAVHLFSVAKGTYFCAKMVTNLYLGLVIGVMVKVSVMIRVSCCSNVSALLA